MTADTSARTGRTLMDSLAVDLPEGELDGLKIERFEIRAGDPAMFAFNLRASSRGVRAGTYTRLFRDGYLWMSDTHAERHDHMKVLLQMVWGKARRVLINGLGLGAIVGAALALDHVEHIDVVEIDPRVAALVGPHYEKSGRVTVHVADAYEQARRWPAGTRWDVGWSDIWPDLCADNLPDMARLNRSYGRRCDWHGCWGQEEIKAHIRQHGW